MLLALAFCIGFRWASATRPARQEDVLTLAGAQDTQYLSPDSRILPKSCKDDGVIFLEPGVTYDTQVGLHRIESRCHTLQGAPGTQLLCSGGIFFENREGMTIVGPLSVTMAPGVPSLGNASAIHAAGNLRVVAPQGAALQFRWLTSSGRGAALRAEGDIFLEGLGRTTFEDIHSSRGGALYTHQLIRSTAAHLEFENCSARDSAGAMFGGKGVILNSGKSDHAIRFHGCKSGWKGGAVSSRGNVELKGKGTFVFEKCHSDLAAGAVGAGTAVVIDLQGEGSVDFVQCITGGGLQLRCDGCDGLGGGAISASKEVNITTGRVRFSGCFAETGIGDAVMSKYGAINIGEAAHVVFAGMDSLHSSRMSARYVRMPPDGTVLPSDVFARMYLFAEGNFSIHEWICPAGTRFVIRADGSPARGQCKICWRGSVSLAPASVRLEGEVKPEAGRKIVLVRHSSPNSLKSLGISILTKAAKSRDDACLKDPGCLGITKSAGQRTAYHNELALVLSYENKRVFTFGNRSVQTERGEKLAVPYNTYYAGVPLALVEPGQHVTWDHPERSQLFELDKDGMLVPAHEPHLTIGLDRDVNYRFEPPDPYGACMTCEKVATHLADKLWCLGASHVRSLPGYMISNPAAGARKVEVHRCPNAAACPGSNLSITAEGRTSSRSRLCATGYKPNPGCTRCAQGYGRPQLDPFICQACGEASLGRQVGIAALSNCIFYGIALKSAKPRSHTQQIVKVFLSFVAVSARSLSAVRHTQHYQQLMNDISASARWLYRSLFAADFVVHAEPGSGVSSFDCWGLVDGQVNAVQSIALSWAIPLILLLLSWSWFGLRSWRLCLVVWGNVFIPPLMGAAAKLVPCFSTQEEGRRVLMYDAAFETPCASKLTESMVLPRYWVAVGTTVLLAVIGPVLWLSIAMPTSSAQKGIDGDLTVGFLVAGYEPRYRWWEVTVLVRKSAIYVVAACFPMSWAPGAHLVYLLFIMVLAELVHGSIRPYVSPRLDRLEGQVLGVSCTSLVLVISLLAEWPYRPYSIYVGTCVLLFLLTAGTYLYFLHVYIRAVFRKDQEEVEDDSQAGEVDGPASSANSPRRTER